MVYSTTPHDEIEICKISKELELSFDDSVQYYVAKAFNLKLVSLDSDFDRTDVGRISPSNLT